MRIWDEKKLILRQKPSHNIKHQNNPSTPRALRFTHSADFSPELQAQTSTYATSVLGCFTINSTLSMSISKLSNFPPLVPPQPSLLKLVKKYENHSLSFPSSPQPQSFLTFNHQVPSVSLQHVSQMSLLDSLTIATTVVQASGLQSGVLTPKSGAVP